jgi:hypothetical protein
MDRQSKDRRGLNEHLRAEFIAGKFEDPRSLARDHMGGGWLLERGHPRHNVQGVGSCTVDSWATMRSLAFDPRPWMKT